MTALIQSVARKETEVIENWKREMRKIDRRKVKERDSSRYLFNSCIQLSPSYYLQL